MLCCYFANGLINIFRYFFSVPENVEEKLKRQKIEAALADPDTPLSKWQEFAKSEYGLVSGKYIGLQKDCFEMASLKRSFKNSLYLQMIYDGKYGQG